MIRKGNVMAHSCVGCGREVSARRRRCPECRRQFRAERARETYHARERERYGDDPLNVAAEVIDYSHGGRSPSLPDDPACPWRQNPRHDAVTRMRLSLQDAAEADMASWADLQTIQQSGRLVDFHPAQDLTPQVDHLGRSVPPGWPTGRPAQPVSVRWRPRSRAPNSAEKSR